MISSTEPARNSEKSHKTVADGDHTESGASKKPKIEITPDADKEAGKKTDEDATRAEVLRKKFAGGGTGNSSSLEEQQCCSKLALNVVHKAWEGAKKAIPSRSSAKKDEFPRSFGETFDPVNPASYPYIDSDNEPPTECSLDYEEDSSELNRDAMFQLRPGVFKPHKPGAKPKIGDIPSDSEESEDRYSPDEMDIDRFKNKYMAGNVIPEETEEDIRLEDEQFSKSAELPRGTEKRKNEMEKRLKKMKKVEGEEGGRGGTDEANKENLKRQRLEGSPKLEKYAKSTTEDVINAAKQKAAEEQKRFSSTSEDKNCLADDEQSMSEKGNSLEKNGIFHLRTRNTEPIKAQESQDSTDAVESITCDMPTITITEDELEDTSCQLSHATTLRSHDDLSELPEDAKAPRTKKEKLKDKVKELGGKVKVIFGKHENVGKEDEKKRKKEEDAKKQAELEAKKKEELARREQEAKRIAEEERKKKEEEAKLKKEADMKKREEELLRKEEELFKEALEEQKREDERRRKEEEKRRKEEEKKKKDEENKMKKKESKKKLLDDLKQNIAAVAEIVKPNKDTVPKESTVIEQKPVGGEGLTEPRDANLETSTKLHSVPEEDFENQETTETAAVTSAPVFVEMKLSDHEYCNVQVVPKIEKPTTPSAETPQPRVDVLSLLKSEPRIVGESKFFTPKPGDDDFFQSDSDEESEKALPRRKRKIKRKLITTKNKLKNFKDKALDSIPKMDKIKSRVKDLFPKGTGEEATTVIHEYEKISAPPREQEMFDEYKLRYPNVDVEFFSDSELMESRRCSARRQQEQQKILDEQAHFYEEMAATEERLQMLLTPVSGPLRPPRRMDFVDNKLSAAASDPTLTKQPPSTKPRRRPPPRPPLPKDFTSMESFSVDPDSAMRDIDLDGSKTDADLDSIREERIPPHLFYKHIRERWQEKNLKRLADLVSRSTPNLPKRNVETVDLYDKPKRPRPIRPPSPKLYDFPRAPRRSLKGGALTAKPPIGRPLHSPTRIEALRGNIPIPPPRLKRSQILRTPPPEFPIHSPVHFKGSSDKAKIATDPLYWRAFSWKTGRCRSLTELYLRKKEVRNSKPIEQSLRYRLTIKYCVPPRPPLPEQLEKVANEPIYSSINKGAKKSKAIAVVETENATNGDKMRDRPLPPPPVPPRPKSRQRRTRGFESINSDGETILVRPLSPNSLSVRDACVSTKDNGFMKLYEKEVQTSLEDLTEDSASETNRRVLDVNANIPTMSPAEVDTNQQRPSQLPTVAKAQAPPAPSEFNQSMPDDISVTSTITGGSYYDAEEEDADEECPEEDTDVEHADQDTFADVESIADTSQFVSFSEITPLSTPTMAGSKSACKTTEVPPSSTDTYFTVDSCKSVDNLKGMPSSSATPAGSRQEVVASGTKSDPRGYVEEEEFGDSGESMQEVKDGDDEYDDDNVQRENGLAVEKQVKQTSKDDDGGMFIRIETTTSEDVDRKDTSSIASETSSIQSAHLLSPPPTAAGNSPYSSDDEDSTYYTPQESPDKSQKKEHEIYCSAKEMMTSEQVYGEVLHLLNQDFRAAVAPYLPEEVLNGILRHLPNLQSLSETLLEEFKARIDNWSNNPRIAGVLIQLGPFLKQYSFYIRNFESTLYDLEEARKKYAGFCHALTEFEKSEKCKKLPVRDYLLKPVQRLPQYKLLLQNYLRHLENRDHPDKEDAEKALEIVTAAAEHANNMMKKDDNVAKLLRLQRSLMGSHEIIKPGRVILKEGELKKLSRKEMQPRLFILCNDCLLYLTQVQQGMYRLNYELPLLGMRVSDPTQEDFQNEFSVITQTRSFTLSASSPEEKQDWLQILRKTIKEYVNRRSTIVNHDSYCVIASETPLGHEAPVWIPDNRVTMCLLCTEEFTVTFRRHHCRACGRVVCSNCSANRAPLKYLKYRADRVCDECFEKLQQQLLDISRTNSQASSGEMGASESEEASSTPGTPSGPLNWDSLKDRFVRMPIRASGRKPKHVPKVLKEVAANDKGSSISGYLYRRKHKKCWTRRWFVIKNNVLYSYKGSEDIKASKTTVLLGYTVSRFTEPLDDIDPTLLFQLTHKGQPDLIFKAETPLTVEKWVKAMQDATVLE